MLKRAFFDLLLLDGVGVIYKQFIFERKALAFCAINLDHKSNSYMYLFIIFCIIHSFNK